jgi:hypothetical protein
MFVLPHRVEVPSAPAEETTTEAHRTEIRPIVLVGEKLLAAQAMQLLIRLDKDLREARAQWNQDWFRRVMRARSHAVSRLRRRWKNINPRRAIDFGNLQRRYHANIAGYLYEPRSRR